MADERLMVEVVDIKMRFWSIVSFMIKCAFASIPAILVVYFIFVVLAALTKTILIG